jgi:colicin import membrane protein
MSERRKRESARNKVIAYTAAGLVHAVIIGALLFNFASKPDSIEADFAEKVDVVKATTVEESEIEKQRNALAEQEREKRRQQELERERLKQLKDDAKKEEQRIEDLKKQQQKEREEAAELERQRKEIALKKQQEEAKRKKEEQERIAREARERKQREERLKKEQEELERIRKEQQELEARRRFQEQLAADEARARAQRAKERATTLSSKYAALIKQKVQPKITISPDFSPTLSTRMNVTLTSLGEVRGVRIIQSSGNSAYDRAVETAIYASSPLPIPSREEDPEVNTMFQDLTLNFSIDGR